MPRSRIRYFLALIAFSSTTMSAVGCICVAAHKAVPVEDCPEVWNVAFRDGLEPIHLALLGQPKPKPRRIAAGDVLSVYIQGVLPSGVTEIPVITRGESFTQIYYPPDGSIRTPSFGVPLEVTEGGTITLPLLGEQPVLGKTIDEAADEIRKSYIAKEILKADRERIFITLIKEGVRRIVVMREDSPVKTPTLIVGPEAPLTKIGNGQVIDLPVYQNDVLHALAASGGMPGIDAMPVAYVIRRQDSGGQFDPAVLKDYGPYESGFDGVATQVNTPRSLAIPIPLLECPGDATRFSPEDVILHDGDTLYIPKREEYFYTAGLLPGRRVPLPRDEDTDILEAITLAAGNVGEPTGITGAGTGNFVTPSLAVVVRKRADGQQLLIRVDLDKALLDPQERIVVQPDDMIILQYKHREAALNFMLNFFNFGFGVTPSDF